MKSVIIVAIQLYVTACIVLIALKFNGACKWPWWQVLAPVWLPAITLGGFVLWLLYIYHTRKK